MTNPIDSDQQSFVLNELVVESGTLPTFGNNPSANPGGILLGSIRTFAGVTTTAEDGTAGNEVPADGQQLTISQNSEIFSVLGNTYGGNGTSNFDLPNLEGSLMTGAGKGGPTGTLSLGDAYGQDSVTLTAANMPTSLGGGGQSFTNDQPSLGVNYLINVGGNGTGLDVPGMIVPYLGATAPNGYMFADGQVLSDTQYANLYAAIGDTYDAGTSAVPGLTFALPNLQGRTIVGAGDSESLGAVVGADSTTITTADLQGATISNQQPSLALTYMIYTASSGAILPSTGALSANTPYLGEIMAFAGTTVPLGWTVAAGQILQITQNEALFSQIGTTYGGNGTTTFELPDLQDRDVVGTSTTDTLGETFGTSAYNLTVSEIPAAAINLGATSAQADEQVGTPLTPTASVTDFLAGTLTIQRNGGANALDRFGFANNSNFTVSGSDLKAAGVTFATFTNSDGVLTIDFASSTSETLIQVVLQDSTYTNLGTGATNTVQLDYTLQPSSGSAVTADLSVDVLAPNQAPSVTLGSAIYSTPAQQSLDLKNTGISVADPDGGNGIETLTISVTEGTPHATVGNSGVTVGSSNDSSDLILSGSISELNALLGSGGTSDLSYIDNTNTPATVLLIFSLDDNGNTGFGGPKTSPNESTTIDVTPCYCPGTLIKTARGEKRVEALKIGDKVLTMSGSARPIKWIGRRSYGGRFVMGRKDILPICIKAGALDENVPKRDLWISPHHAMYFKDENGGVLIEAKDLINGISIVQAERVETVEYFHIELETHDVIVAEGALSESYLDDDNRMMFHNAPDYYALYPDGVTAPRYCSPRLDEGFEVETVRRRIAVRAGLLRAADGERIGSLRGYIDEANTYRIVGWAQNVDHPDAPVCLDILANGQLIGQVLANRHRADLEQAGIGSGFHAFEFILPTGIDLAAETAEVRRSLDGVALQLSADSRLAVRPRRCLLYDASR